MPVEDPADLAAMFDTAEFAEAATYRAGGVGAPQAVAVIRGVPDRISDGFGTPILQASDVLRVTLASLPTWAAGDTFTIGTEVLTVQHAEKDATGATWRVMCQR